MKRRSRSRHAFLPPLLAAWHAGEPPPSGYEPTAEELEQISEVEFFASAEVNGRMVETIDWHDHPHRSAWSEFRRASEARRGA